MVKRALLLLLVACGRPAVAPAPASPTSFSDGMVSFDGKTFHLHCEGATEPTVVLEAGQRGTAWVWSDELPVVAKYTRVCAFDQLGGGYSGPEPKARTDAEIADDTWELLRRAGEHPPYVAVGYGLGDTHAQAFGERHSAVVVTLGPGIPPREAMDRSKEEIRKSVQDWRVGHERPNGTPPPTPMSGDDGLVKVANSTLHMHCAGTGSPIVVFDAGRDGGGWHWLGTQREIAKQTRTCVYDRLGLGLSGPANLLSHTSEMMVNELRAALATIHAAPPYVLVGHSFGGMNVQLFTSEHREDVAGLVLVDPMSEKAYLDYVETASPTLRVLLEASLSGSADGNLDTFLWSCKQMADARKPFGDLPLVVLHHSEALRVASLSDRENEHMDQTWMDATRAVAASSTNSAFVAAEKTGHMIPYDQPALVTAAVREVLNAVRTHGRVDGARVHAANGPLVPAPAW